MAVITELHRSDIDRVLAQYELGSLVSFRETAHGIENSNYFVCVEQEATTSGRFEYVLTVLEEQELDNRSLVVAVLDHCSEQGLPVPTLLRTSDGATIAHYQGREILLCERLLGNHVLVPTTQHCAAIGRFLARLHTILQSMSIYTAYERNLEWIKRVSTECQDTLPTDESRMLRRVISLIGSLLRRNDVQRIPQGIIHGDLFRDNVLFNEHGLCGILDFHHAGQGFWLFDLAVAINDWGRENGSLDRDKTFTMLREYNSIRKLIDAEYWCFPQFLLYAATSFWLSRLAISVRDDLPDRYPRKDPKEFAEIVEEHLMRPFQIHELVVSI